MSVLLVLLVTIFLLLTGFYIQFRWQNRHILSAASKLPCPPSVPIFGNALLFMGDITSMTKKIIMFTSKFKKLFCIWVGPVPVFVVSDPTDVQIILNNSNTLEKDEIYQFLRPFLGNALFLAPVPMWKKYRRLISPLLHPGNVDKFIPVFNDVSSQLVETLGRQGELVDPRSDIFETSMDAITRTLLALNPMDKMTKDNIQFLLSTVGRMFTYRLFKLWLHIEWLFNLLYKKQMREVMTVMSACWEVFDKEWEGYVETRSTNTQQTEEPTPEIESGKNLLDLSLDHPPEGTEDHKWRDEIIAMIVGATDTVVSALAFLFVTLANNPEVQEKVHAEMEEVMRNSGQDLTLHDLNAMTYLGQAIMETIRLHGTFPVAVRRATRDTKLSDGILPAGSRIMVPLQAMGWNEDQFPQPEKFTPERFSPEALRDRHPYAFLPFSGGPRNCLGKTYAMHLMKIVAVHVLRKYNIKTRVRLQDIEYEFKVVMFSKTPLLLHLEPRTDPPVNSSFL